jgi:hypothetical protein
MANPSQLGALLFADEATFGASGAFDERLPIIAQVDVSGLSQEMVPIDPVKQYQNDGDLMMRGTQSGSFTVELYLCGHGSATTGAISATATENFLARVFGNANHTNDGGTVNTPTDADTFSATGATIANGSVIRMGTLGDARGDGQFQAVSNGSTVQTLTALGATPNASDVIYTPVQIFPSEIPTGSAITSQRFEILTGNQQYRCYGCFPTGVSISGLNAGEIPRISVTMSVSRWETNSGTFPTATAVDAFVPSPVAAGSFFFQTFGTTTRQTYSIREFNLNIDFATTEIRGPGASSAHQVIVGAKRTKCQASFDFVIDAETAGTTTFETLWNTAENSATFKHALYSCSVGRDGASLGFYFPKIQLVGARPTQFDMDGISRQRISCRAVTSSATSTALERANFIMALG